MNTLFFGDNLDVLRKHIRDESVDLVYLDPPFNSNTIYNVLYKTPHGKGVGSQVKAFKDTWSWEEDAASLTMDDIRRTDVPLFRILQALQVSLGESDLMAYLAMMSVRLLELRRVLKRNGSIFLHCDPTASHYLKLILDGVFGANRFQNEIIWQRSTGKALTKRRLPSNHDSILFYADDDHIWNDTAAFLPYDQKSLPAKTAAKYSQVDADGRRFQLDNLVNPNADRPNLKYEFLGVTRVWRWTRERMEEAHAAGQVVQVAPGRVPRLKRYLDEQRGLPLGDVWSDIPPLNSQARERIGYPTQKPTALLKRILSLSAKSDAVVLDPFCGCGTTIHAAEEAGLTWIGIDVAYAAIQVIQDRLQTWLPDAKYKVQGIPSGEDEARALAKLDPYIFQQWAVGRLGGQPRGRGADGGIDGEIIFVTGVQKYGRGIVSVKGGLNIGPAAVRELAWVVEREGADIGVFVCLNPPTKDMRLEAQRSGHVELPGGVRTRVQIVTVADLIAGANLGILTELNALQVAEAARMVARAPKRPTPEQLRKQPPLPPMGIAGGKSAAVQRPLPLDEPLMAAEPETKFRHNR